MDRNTIIGFVLMALLLIGYVAWNSHSQTEYKKQQQHIADSLAKLRPVLKADSSNSPVVSAAGTADTLRSDSLRLAQPPALRGGAAQNIRLENKDVALDFTTKGGYPTAALLKHYKTYDATPLYLFKGPANKLVATLPANVADGRTTEELMFTPTQQGPNAVTFTADLGGGKAVALSYALPAEGYMLQVNARLTGINTNILPVRWQMQSLHSERDIATERVNSQIYYHYKNNEDDYYTIRDGNELKDLTEDGAMHWIGFRMHFFSSAIVGEEGFTRTRVESTTKLADSSIVAQQKTTFELPVKGDGTAALRWYIGPNDYKTLRSYKIGMDEMVPLGVGIFSFVKYINKWLIVPVFDLLRTTGLNMGIVIMLLTVMIRLLLSFFTYKSYLSAAKMRVLKPELDELRAKFGTDQQRMGVEQMKLYRGAGVNPLGGCLPTLFQLPILIAMYSFFPSAIQLRQEKFLWANDLSTYDSILNLGFNIPFYGSHVSLFTLLMTASSLFLALYNRNMTPQDPNNPLMKWMPFIFPILLIGVFNKMAAALTFYYFFSNMLAILQQFIIQKFIINEDKIHAQIQENRNKPAMPSKWQQRMEEMQRAQQERQKQRGK